MANAVTTTILQDGDSHVKLRVEGILDTSDLVQTVIAYPDTLGATSYGKFGVRLDRVEFSIENSLNVNLFWDATTPVRILQLTGDGDMDFTKFGGITNPADKTTSSRAISLTTQGWSATAILSFTMVLHLVKHKWEHDNSTVSDYSLFLPLRKDLLAVGGVVNPTFTRATAAAVQAYNASDTSSASLSWVQVAVAEARFQGARRVSAGVWSDTFADGVPIPESTLKGYLSEGQRTQYLGVTEAPATQTTASLGTGTYCLWIEGTGSATSSAGTATGSGWGAATAGSPNVITITGAGTVTVTVAGSPTRFQLENGAEPSSYIWNTGAAGTSVTRNADVLSYAIASELSDAAGTICMTASSAYSSSALPTQARFVSFNSGNIPLFLQGATGAIESYDGTNTTSAGVPTYPFAGKKVAVSWMDTTNRVAVDGVVYSGAFDGAMSVLTPMIIGNRSDGALALFGTIKNVRTWDRALSDAEMIAITS